MTKQQSPTELQEHLSRHFGLEREIAARVVAEVVSYFDESVADFIQRRHAELQREGVGNTEIFRCLQLELNERLFSVATLSERQIRRIIYG